MKFTLWSFVAVLLLAVLILACCGKSTRYFIYMVNRTPRDFDGVGVYYGEKMAAEAGHLVKGGLASFGYVTLPIPDQAEVRWDDQDTHHAPKVKLRGVVPDNPVGMNIYFIIEEDGSVTVKCVRYDDQKARQEATKGIEKYRGK